MQYQKLNMERSLKRDFRMYVSVNARKENPSGKAGWSTVKKRCGNWMLARLTRLGLRWLFCTVLTWRGAWSGAPRTAYQLHKLPGKELAGSLVQNSSSQIHQPRVWNQTFVRLWKIRLFWDWKPAAVHFCVSYKGSTVGDCRLFHAITFPCLKIVKCMEK